MNYKGSILSVFAIMALAAVLGAAFMYSQDAAHYQPLVNELLQKCGEPCL